MYPEDKDIKGAWKIYHFAAIVLSTLIIWLLFFIKRGYCFNHENTIALLTVLGLNLDIIGVVIASIEAPYFGLFLDGGEHGRKRYIVKEKYFKWGLLLIGLGFFLHGIAVIIS